MYPKFGCFCIVLIACMAFGQYRNVIANSSFEDGITAYGYRPVSWMVGFVDSDIGHLGRWSLDSTISTDGMYSLKMQSLGDEDDGYFLTQIIDCNTYDLDGKTVDISVDIKNESFYGAYIVVIALQPESADSFLGTPAVGGVMLYPEPHESDFTTLTGSFTASGPAQFIVAMIMIQGHTDFAWFDNFTVSFDDTPPGECPDTTGLPDLFGGAERSFYLGTTNEIPANLSEAAQARLSDEIAEIGDMMNLFFHIEWNSLSGEPLTKGHERVIRMGEIASEKGLEIMLTLDFTHDSPSTLGDIIPLPDGTPIDSLSPDIRNAYIAELLALVDAVDPIAVMVGIETSLYHRYNPDDWHNYVLLMAEVNDALSHRPDIHISAYAILGDIITRDGHFIPSARAAWEEIMPYCASVAYSVYPELEDTALYADPLFFTRLGEIAPEKPLLIAEFGIRSDTLQGFSEDIQLDFLQKALTALAGTTPSPYAVIWYGMHDTPYFGIWDHWFVEAFSTIGLKDYLGTSKKSFAALRRMRELERIDEAPAAFIPQSLDIAISPNPFNSACRIVIAGTPNELLKVDIISTDGRLVRNIALNAPPGTYHWNGTDNHGQPVESGVYIVVVGGKSVVQSGKVLLVR